MNTDFDANVIDALCNVAPDLDGTPIGPDDDLQNDLGLDSMDSFNLVIAIKDLTGIDIEDSAVPSLRTVRSISSYLRERAQP
jgi:acyl carrier protein